MKEDVQRLQNIEHFIALCPIGIAAAKHMMQFIALAVQRSIWNKPMVTIVGAWSSQDMAHELLGHIQGKKCCAITTLKKGACMSSIVQSALAAILPKQESVLIVPHGRIVATSTALNTILDHTIESQRSIRIVQAPKPPPTTHRMDRVDLQQILESLQDPLQLEG